MRVRAGVHLRPGLLRLLAPQQDPALTGIKNAQRPCDQESAASQRLTIVLRSKRFHRIPGFAIHSWTERQISHVSAPQIRHYWQGKASVRVARKIMEHAIECERCGERLDRHATLKNALAMYELEPKPAPTPIKPASDH